MSNSLVYVDIVKYPLPGLAISVRYTYTSMVQDCNNLEKRQAFNPDSNVLSYSTVC